TARTAAQKRAVAEAAIETLASDLRQIPEARRGPAAEASRYLDRLRSGDLDVDNVWDVLRHMLFMHQFNRPGDVAGLPEHEDPEWHQRAEVAIKKAIDRLREAGMDPHSRAAKKAAKAAPRKATQSAEQRR